MDKFVKMLVRGKSSYCGEPGITLNEEREKDIEGGGVTKASFFFSIQGPPAGWLSYGELCPLARRKLAKLFTLIYAH